MSAAWPPAGAPPQGVGQRLVRGVRLALLVFAGLAVGAIAGLFVAGALGWLPSFAC